MTARHGGTVPTEVAAAVLGVHERTIQKWTRERWIEAEVPASGTAPARYDVAELHRWVRENTEGHGPECRVHHDPFLPGVECGCVACYCGDAYGRGWMGSCARCHRPLIRDGKVVR